VLELLRKEREVAELRGKISDQVNEKVSTQQREFFLREQLKVIEKELGISKDDRTAEAERFKARLKKLTLPEARRSGVDEELDKLSVLETGSPEYGVTRNYLDWITLLPWGVTPRTSSISSAPGGARPRPRRPRRREGAHPRVPRRRHPQGRDRRLHHPAGRPARRRQDLHRPLRRRRPGPQLLPLLSLGGMRDEAEIKGHRRTYIGAMPGKFIQAIKEAGTANPVIMLDEIDKIGASYHGDPASALLEVLDPEQNSEFLDHYLDLRVDLSQGAVRLHREPARQHPRAAARPHGDPAPGGLRRGGEAGNRPQPPVAEAAGASRTGGGAAAHQRRGAEVRDRVLLSRGRRAQSRKAAGADHAQVDRQLRKGRRRPAQHRQEAISKPCSASRCFRDERRSAASAWRRAWPGPRWAARRCRSSHREFTRSIAASSSPGGSAT
jgi:hypothetical protein